MEFFSINPYTQATLASYTSLSDIQIDDLLHKSETTQRLWRKTSITERITLFKRLIGNIENRKEEFAKLITAEMGKVYSESVIEIDKCIAHLRYFNQHIEQFLEPNRIAIPNGDAWVRYDALGAVLGIMPWNFPFWQVFRFAIPALYAGNAVFLKHAPNVFGCGEAIAKLFDDSGFPENLFNHLIVEVEQVKKLIDHDFIQAVSFTGSEFAGSQIASIAGTSIKKTVLELGGSDPFIVCADASLDQTVEIAVKSRMINAGQSCIAAKRFIIHESVYDEFYARFKSKMFDLKMGDPMEKGTDYGPLARVDLSQKLHRQIEDSRRLGAHVEVKVFSQPPLGSLYPATIISNTNDQMPAFKEEMFGPAAVLFKVKNDSQAISLANATRYGLGASIWSQDIDRAKVMAEDIQAGSVYINSLMKSDVHLPFGGVKKSGYGRELSRYGLLEFVNIKSIVALPA